MVTPYFKELMPVAKGHATGAILMAQLEWRFAKYPNGFYKFTEPCLNAKYTVGDSWVEELGFTDKQFRTAFDTIGVRYKSKKEFNLSLAKSLHFMAIVPGSDELEEKFYCCYTDRKTGLTWYCRNERKVNELLNQLELEIAEDILRKKDNTNSVTSKGEVTVTSQAEVTVTSQQGDPLYIQKTTIYSESTQEADSVCELKEVDGGFPEEEKEVASEKQLEQVKNLASNAANKKEITQPTQEPKSDQTSAKFESSEQKNFEPIEDVNNLPKTPSGVRILPWEKQGASPNNRYDESFARWLYDTHLKKYPTAFTSKGYELNRQAVFHYLRKAHFEMLRLERIASFWNDYLKTLDAPQDDTSLDNALESFTTGCGDKLRQIVLSNNFSPEQLDYIAKLWVAGGKRETLTINLMRKEGLIAEIPS